MDGLTGFVLLGVGVLSGWVTAILLFMLFRPRNNRRRLRRLLDDEEER